MYNVAARLLLALLPVLAGCATVFDESLALATVPYYIREDGRIAIAASVNGSGPHRFAIDTAASRSVIYSGLRIDLGIELSERDVMVQGMTTAGLFPLTHVEEIGIGAAAWRNVDLVALPGDVRTAAAFDGILGLDFLRDFTVVFSAQSKQLALFRPDDVAADAYQGWLALPMTARSVSRSGRSFFFFTLRLGRNRVPAVLDLGAGFNVINWPAAELLDLDPAYLRRKQADEIIGAIGTTPDVFHVGIDKFEIGAMTWRNESFIIGDLPVFTTLVDPEKPAAILGAALFLRRDFVIDFSRSRVLINLRR